MKVPENLSEWENDLSKSVSELAEEHAEWTSKLFRWIYKEAFIHGYKHGKEEKNGIR